MRKRRFTEEQIAHALRQVEAGHLGRKSGKGWYEYDEDGGKIEAPSE